MYISLIDETRINQIVVSIIDLRSKLEQGSMKDTGRGVGGMFALSLW